MWSSSSLSWQLAILVSFAHVTISISRAETGHSTGAFEVSDLSPPPSSEPDPSGNLDLARQALEEEVKKGNIPPEALPSLLSSLATVIDRVSAQKGDAVVNIEKLRILVPTGSALQSATTKTPQDGKVSSVGKIPDGKSVDAAADSSTRQPASPTPSAIVVNVSGGEVASPPSSALSELSQKSELPSADLEDESEGAKRRRPRTVFSSVPQETTAGESTPESRAAKGYSDSVATGSGTTLALPSESNRARISRLVSGLVAEAKTEARSLAESRSPSIPGGASSAKKSVDPTPEKGFSVLETPRLAIENFLETGEVPTLSDAIDSASINPGDTAWSWPTKMGGLLLLIGGIPYALRGRQTWLSWWNKVKLRRRRVASGQEEEPRPEARVIRIR